MVTTATTGKTTTMTETMTAEIATETGNGFNKLLAAATVILVQLRGSFYSCRRMT